MRVGRGKTGRGDLFKERERWREREEREGVKAGREMGEEERREGREKDK